MNPGYLDRAFRTTVPGSIRLSLTDASEYASSMIVDPDRPGILLLTSQNDVTRMDDFDPSQCTVLARIRSLLPCWLPPEATSDLSSRQNWEGFYAPGMELEIHPSLAPSSDYIDLFSIDTPVSPEVETDGVPGSSRPHSRYSTTGNEEFSSRHHGMTNSLSESVEQFENRLSRLEKMCTSRDSILQASSSAFCGLETQPFVEFLHDMLVHPLRLSISASKVHGVSARNIAIEVLLKDNDDDLHDIGLPQIFGRPGEPLFYSSGISATSYHAKPVDFADEFRIRLPLRITQNHHLLFRFYHIQCKDIKPSESTAIFIGLSLSVSFLCIYLYIRLFFLRSLRSFLVG